VGYLVLARKYRPQTFDAMSGQEHVVRTLANALAGDRLAHAFLFTGPRGVGKTTAARLVAKAVNCEKGPTAQPCGACIACQEIAEGRAVDVVEIDAASNNGVDNIRDIVEAVKYRPARDRYKVFVVDEVHMLSQGAFNALLKTLEEPPPHVKFVLATTDVHKVPETIVSRCQRFDFRRLTLQQLVGQLGKVAEAEGMMISGPALAMLARSAEGGMRDALSLLDQVRAACGDSPGDEAVAEALGAVDPAAVGRLAGALLERNGAAILAEIEAIYTRGLEMRRLAEALCHWLRDAVVAKLVPNVPIDRPDGELKALRAQAERAEAVQLTRLFDLCQLALTEVKEAGQPRHALEVALLKGCFLAPGVEVSALVERLESLAGSGPPGPGGSRAPAGASGARPPARPAEQAPPTARAGSEPPALRPRASSDPLTLSEAPAGAESKAFGTPGCAAGPAACEDPAPAAEGGAPADRWRAAVAEVEKSSAAVGPVLRQASLLKLEEGEVTIQFAAGSANAARMERWKADLELALARHFGRPTRLVVDANGPRPTGDVVAAAGSLAAEDRVRRDVRSREVKESAQKHPGISEAVRILGGEIGGVEEV
jgi:DNA polymerase-3 subunit gamma/tau